MALDEQGTHELDQVRARLDALDRELIEILARRFQVGEEAARVKRALGMPVHDPARERQVVAQATQWARNAGLPESDVADLFVRLIEISRRAQLASTQ